MAVKPKTNKKYASGGAVVPENDESDVTAMIPASLIKKAFAAGYSREELVGAIGKVVAGKSSGDEDLDALIEQGLGESAEYKKGGAVKPKPKPKTKPAKPVPPHEQMEKLIAKGKLPKDFIEKYTQAEIGKKAGKLKELNQTFMAAGGKVELPKDKKKLEKLHARVSKKLYK